MKWRHWSILIVLVLLNYIIFSSAFIKLSEQHRPGPQATRTPPPTFEHLDPTPAAWIVLPTSTPLPTKTPYTPMPTEPIPLPTEITSTIPVTASFPGEPLATETLQTAPSDTPVAPTAVPTTEALTHVIQRGETLSQIAQVYGVSVQALVDANGLANPSHIITGQTLMIPASGQASPAGTALPQPKAANTPRPAATKAPTPKPTRRPPTATATPASAGLQFTAEVIWRPLVAPNCSGPGISKESVIKDAAGNPVNGVRVEVDCYSNIWRSHPSGTPGEYDAGHYDFAFGQTSPQDWTCTARIFDINGQLVASSEVVTIHFDTNNCKPHGIGHQVAVVDWTKHW
jgi:LysM repeat protein